MATAAELAVKVQQLLPVEHSAATGQWNTVQPQANGTHCSYKPLEHTAATSHWNTLQPQASGTHSVATGQWNRVQP